MQFCHIFTFLTTRLCCKGSISRKVLKSPFPLNKRHKTPFLEKNPMSGLLRFYLIRNPSFSRTPNTTICVQFRSHFAIFLHFLTTRLCFKGFISHKVLKSPFPLNKTHKTPFLEKIQCRDLHFSGNVMSGE